MLKQIGVSPIKPDKKERIRFVLLTMDEQGPTINKKMS